MSKIFVVTNRLLSGSRSFTHIISEVVHGEPDAIILREKDLLPAELNKIASMVREICDGTRTKLLINSSIEAALAAEADGVHLGYGSLPVDAARKLLPNKTIGVSVHSLEEAETAQTAGADYVLAGHVYPTKSKSGQPGRGLPFINQLSSVLQIPVIAIGGINSCNASEVIHAGAAGVAVMSLIMEADNIPGIIQTLRTSMGAS